MKFLRWLRGFWDGLMANQADPPDTLPGLVPPTPIEKCPYPLSTDDGTRVDCKTKRHCGCEDAL